jgi:hypothetical protein
MEGVLKGLQGKNLSKKGLFDFLADIDLDTLYGKKENAVSTETGIGVEKTSVKSDDVKVVAKSDDVKILNIEPKEIKCSACAKTFTVEASLRRHLERSIVCVNWNNLPQKMDGAKLTKGLHLIIDELLDKAIGSDLECKHCKTKFTSKGNLHKHFNSASVCNRLAYQDFKSMFNNF